MHSLEKDLIEFIGQSYSVNFVEVDVDELIGIANDGDLLSNFGHYLFGSDFPA